MAKPIQPRNLQDPAGTKGLRDRSIREARKRMRKAAQLIRQYVESMPYTVKQVDKADAPSVPKSAKRTSTLKNAQQYTWLVDDALMNQAMRYIQGVLADALINGDESWSYRWWMNAYLDPSAEMGMSESLANAQRLVAETTEEAQRIANIITAEQVLMSPPYQRRLKLMHGRVFEEMKGLTSETTADLRRVLTDGMARGLGIRDLTGIINDRVGVSLSRAERIARTEINRTYTNAYMDETDDFNQILEDEDDPWVIREMHVSALTMTTRRSHAARHGGIFTHQQQNNWWDSGSNRVNCYCSVMSVLVHRKTGELHPSSKSVVERVRERGEQYF